MARVVEVVVSSMANDDVAAALGEADEAASCFSPFCSSPSEEIGACVKLGEVQVSLAAVAHGQTEAHLGN